MKVLVSKFLLDQDLERDLASLAYEPIIFDKDKGLSEEALGVKIVLAASDMGGLDFSQFKDLEAVLSITQGVDYLPLKTLDEMGVRLSNNPGAYALPIGEFIVMNILNFAKKTRIFAKLQDKRTWKPDSHLMTLAGRGVLLLGTGTIAQAAATRLKAFGMEVWGMNTSGKKPEGFDRIISREDLGGALGQVDFVVSTLPDTQGTLGLCDGDFFSAMKKGAYFVNISRGSVVVQDDLISALKSGQVGGAALDVFEVEPLPEDSPLWDMDQVYVYPHTSYGMERISDVQMVSIMENLKRISKGQDLAYEIDLKKGY